MSSAGAHEIGGASLVIRPNRSLSTAGMVVMFAVLSTLVLTVGVCFALAGAWMVLPFALMEITIFGLLCRWLYRHVDDCELVVIEPERVRVIKRCGAEVSQSEFARYWVRVRFDRAGGTRPEHRLRIGSHGKFVALADDVSEDGRRIVARELEGLLRSAG